MTEITIEKGIAIPSVTRANGSKYPFDNMEVNDSFLFPEGTTGNQASTAISSVRKRLTDRKFSYRTVEDGRIRCWRIE